MDIHLNMDVFDVVGPQNKVNNIFPKSKLFHCPRGILGEFQAYAASFNLQ